MRTVSVAVKSRYRPAETSSAAWVSPGRVARAGDRVIGPAAVPVTCPCPVKTVSQGWGRAGR